MSEPVTLWLALAVCGLVLIVYLVLALRRPGRDGGGPGAGLVDERWRVDRDDHGSADGDGGGD